MVCGERVPDSWQPALAGVLAQAQTAQLDQFLAARAAAGARIYPPHGQRLAALALTPLDAVRVVILGQDPYHGAGQGHGLAFSVRKGVAVPPSLANIYKELQADIGFASPTHGDLTPWAQQGVLLLNTTLTVEDGQAGSHQGQGWEALTDACVAAVAALAEPCVFMLWGAHAQKKAAKVGGGHLVLQAPHPSPLSAYRGWFGSLHFSKANAFLTQHGRGAINWHLP
jgi:uracil-DNA glycosylase